MEEKIFEQKKKVELLLYVICFYSKKKVLLEKVYALIKTVRQESFKKIHKKYYKK